MAQNLKLCVNTYEYYCCELHQPLVCFDRNWHWRLHPSILFHYVAQRYRHATMFSRRNVTSRDVRYPSLFLAQKRLPPGARARHTQMWPILQAMTSVSSAAEMAASDSAARLRELRGSGSSAVAVSAATAHELSLEKDTWSLLLYLNGADEEDENIKEDVRRQEEANNSSG